MVSPENQILLCVAHRSLDSEYNSRLSTLLCQELDWTYLISSAERHALIPLLYLHLQSHFQSMIPAAAMAQLAQTNREIATTSLFLTGELVKILEIFGSQNIPVLPFKGPVLGILAYGDPSLRQFGDLDLLIRKRDVAKVRDLLAQYKFRPVPPLTAKQQAAVEHFECAWNFENENGAIVDVHWDVVDRNLAIPTSEKFWTALESVVIGDSKYPTLSAENLLLVLCLHGFTHRWERLGWLCDVASVIESHAKIDWQKIIESATQLGVRRILMLGLKLAHELLGTEMPDGVLNLADAKVHRAVVWARDNLFIEAARVSLLDETLFFVNMRERRRDRIRSAVSLITSPRKFDWMYLSLPASVLSLYYPLRPLRLAVKYGKRLIQGNR